MFQRRVEPWWVLFYHVKCLVSLYGWSYRAGPLVLQNVALYGCGPVLRFCPVLWLNFVIFRASSCEVFHVLQLCAVTISLFTVILLKTMLICHLNSRVRIWKYDFHDNCSDCYLGCTDITVKSIILFFFHDECRGPGLLWTFTQKDTNGQQWSLFSTWLKGKMEGGCLFRECMLLQTCLTCLRWECMRLQHSIPCSIGK